MNNKHKPVDAIKHDNDTRATIPTTELAGSEAAAVSDEKQSSYDTFRHEFNRGRDPELYWLNKYNNDDEETQRSDLRVDIRSLYVHEQIRPEMLINNLYSIGEQRRNENQGLLFDEAEIPNVIEDELARVTEYYRHTDKWKNRLVQGDSLLVMNSLLRREGMAGKVQCIYMDPPYGIKFGSNWQMKLNDKNVKDSDDNLTGEPEMIKAFRDTWEMGIHSYLQYLRDRMVLSRELLSDTGSIFIQISDDNSHLIRNILDEVFGSENFISMIPFRKKLMPLGANTLEGMCDYIIWYAKNIQNIKYRALYKQSKPRVESRWTNVLLPNGEKRKLSQKDDISNLPDGSKVYRLVSQRAPSFSQSNVYDYVFEGKTYCPPKGGCWVTTKERMDRLRDLGRLEAEGDNLSYIY